MLCCCIGISCCVQSADPRRTSSIGVAVGLEILPRTPVLWRCLGLPTRTNAYRLSFEQVSLILLGCCSSLTMCLLLLYICGALYAFRSEEHTSELQSLMHISYAVFG